MPGHGVLKSRMPLQRGHDSGVLTERTETLRDEDPERSDGDDERDGERFMYSI